MTQDERTDIANKISAKAAMLIMNEATEAGFKSADIMVTLESTAAIVITTLTMMQSPSLRPELAEVMFRILADNGVKRARSAIELHVKEPG